MRLAFAAALLVHRRRAMRPLLSAWKGRGKVRAATLPAPMPATLHALVPGQPHGRVKFRRPLATALAMILPATRTAIMLPAMVRVAILLPAMALLRAKVVVLLRPLRAAKAMATV